MSAGPELGDPGAAALARQWLALGPGLVDAIGAGAGNAITGGLSLLDATGSFTADLRQVTEDLMPLMASFRQGARKPPWWSWFTGERLERDVFFEQTKQRIETLAERGDQVHATLQRQVRSLAEQDGMAAALIARLTLEVEAARLVGSTPYAKARSAAGLIDDDLARLARRADNLDSIIAAAQLTRAQYRIASQTARSIADRFTEVRALLLPLWKQAVGFELFSQRVSARIDTGT